MGGASFGCLRPNVVGQLGRRPVQDLGGLLELDNVACLVHVLFSSAYGVTLQPAIGSQEKALMFRILSVCPKMDRAPPVAPGESPVFEAEPLRRGSGHLPDRFLQGYEPAIPRVLEQQEEEPNAAGF